MLVLSVYLQLAINTFTIISSLKDYDEKLGELLENVSISEMLHMETLAYLMKKLGGKPTIRGSFNTSGNFWMDSYIYYGSYLCEQLKADINAKYKAIEEYQKHIHAIGRSLHQSHTPSHYSG